MKPTLFLTLLFLTSVLSVSATSYDMTARVHLNITIPNDDFGTANYDQTVTIIDQAYTGLQEKTLLVPSGMYDIKDLLIHYSPEGYTTTYSEGCRGILDPSEEKTCIITNNDPEAPRSNGEWCYQETANEATSCGGLASGTYGYSGEAINVDFSNDGNWSRRNAQNIHGEYLTIYSKPAHALPTSVLKLKDVREGPEINIAHEELYPIPETCFTQEQLKFTFTVRDALITGTCWNGNDWTAFRNLTWDDFSGQDFEGIIEEAMIWDMKTETPTPSEPPSETTTRAYYGQGMATNVENGFLINTLWMRTVQSELDVGEGTIQLNTGKDAITYNLIKKESPKNKINFDVLSKSKKIGILTLTRTPKPQLTVWDGELSLTEGRYQGSYDVNLGSKSKETKDPKRVNQLVIETNRFSIKENFFSNLLKKIFN